MVSSWQFIMLIGFLVGVCLYGWSVGRNRLFAALLSTYLSYTIVKAIPWQGINKFISVKPGALPSYEIFFFIAIFLALLFLLPRSSIGSSLRLHKRIKGQWYEVLIFSILQVGLLICLILSFLPSKVILDLTPILRQYFMGEEIKFIWIFLPIVFLMLLGRRSADD